MPFDHQLLLVKAFLFTFTIAVLFIVKKRLQPSSRIIIALVFGFSLLGIVAYLNFGFLHGSSLFPLSHAVYRLPHSSENFHYRLNSKYFDELGYDGLYIASVAAQEQTAPHLPLQDFIRDIRTNEIVATAYLDDLKRTVLARFTAQRWQEFKQDHQHFLEVIPLDRLEKTRLDHGFNATPTWTFVGKIFDFWLPVNQKTIVALAVLDLLLLLSALIAVWKAYGLETTCLVAVLLGFGYSWNFSWTGGTYLRMDWIAALIIGICCLKQERFSAAGFLLGYAIMSRLFPILLLFGPALLAFKSVIRRRKLPSWAPAFSKGLILGVLLSFFLGSLAGRGVTAWGEFLDKIGEHHATWSTNLVGLRTVLLSSSEIFNRHWIDTDASQPDPWNFVKKQAKKISDQRKALIIATTLLFLLLLAAGSWTAKLDEAVVLSSVAVFALVQLSNYYWILLLVVPLRIHYRNSSIILLLLINLVLALVHIASPFNEVRFGVMSWLLTVFFIAWLTPEALKNLSNGFKTWNRWTRSRPSTQ